MTNNSLTVTFYQNRHYIIEAVGFALFHLIEVKFEKENIVYFIGSHRYCFSICTGMGARMGAPANAARQRAPANDAQG